MEELFSSYCVQTALIWLFLVTEIMSFFHSGWCMSIQYFFTDVFGKAAQTLVTTLMFGHIEPHWLQCNHQKKNTTTEKCIVCQTTWNIIHNDKNLTVGQFSESIRFFDCESEVDQETEKICKEIRFFFLVVIFSISVCTENKREIYTYNYFQSWTFF